MTGVFALAALLIGLSKGGLGGPVPVALTVPLLSLVISVPQAVGIVLPLLMFADVIALTFYWRQWEMRYIRLLVPAAVLGVLIGTLLLATLPNDLLRRIVGGFTLLAVVYKLANDRLAALEYSPRPWHGRLAGGVAGFGSALANVGAPAFTAYMLLQPGMTPTAFIGTTTLFFAIVNALKLPGFLYSGVLQVDLLLQIVWVAPIIPLGVWLGRFVIQRIDPRLFEVLILGLLLLMSIWLILGG
ncbi:MAG: sulfite exporter TauE/SafE family protein [Armatimonadetes bacterium]|nr:sulfite exporter TauE/SafE family protein [Anaerolineae bacterium]